MKDVRKAYDVSIDSRVLELWLAQWAKERAELEALEHTHLVTLARLSAVEAELRDKRQVPWPPSDPRSIGQPL